MCFLEEVMDFLIHREEPGAGNIVTFFQFLFIAVEGFFVSHFCQKPTKIPIKSYMILVGLYFTVSVVNNMAFNFDIPLPLHMIFRAVSAIFFNATLYLDLLHYADTHYCIASC